MAQPNPPTPGKMEQLQNTGKKAAEQMKDIAGETGAKLKNLLSNNDTGANPGKLSDNQIKNQKMEGQVLFFTFLFLTINAQSNEISKVVIQNENSSSIPILVEVMITESQQARGMMYRKSLDKDKGMLFLFNEPKRAVFWMKNTYIPLDLIFIKKGGDIDSIHENLEPLSTKKIKSRNDVIAVLEILGGQVKINEINLDSKILF